MDKSIKTLLFVIAISLVGVNVQLFVDTDNLFIKEAKADVAGMNYRELRRDRDFKKAVRYVVENNCTVYSEQYLSC